VAEALSIERFVAARGQALLRFAYVLAGDLPAAEDLVQDTLVRLMPRWHRVVRSGHAERYVRRTLVNIFLDGRRRAQSRELPVGWAHPDSAFVADHSVAVASRAETMAWLARLPPRQRVIVALKYLEDLDDATIADAVGCAQSTVRSQASRAMATLRSSGVHGGGHDQSRSRDG
jgi:RNA polymerase sigma-70 factor (sigma-E family)